MIGGEGTAVLARREKADNLIALVGFVVMCIKVTTQKKCGILLLTILGKCLVKKLKPI